VSHGVWKRPIWLGDAGAPEADLRPTIQRIAGSWRRRSGVVYVLISRKPREHGLPQQPDQGMATILAGAGVSERAACHGAEAEGVGRDDGAAKLERQSAVEIEPGNAIG
jgi:hypothetical protein